MVGSNYPPGMSSRDFVRAGIDQPHSHEHEFREESGDMIFEDGAVIVHKRCNYREGRYGEGYRCEETRTYRCDVQRVEKIREGQPDVAYLADEQDPMGPWNHFDVVFEEALCGIGLHGEHTEIEAIDPPSEYGDGYVRLKVAGYRLVYEQ